MTEHKGWKLGSLAGATITIKPGAVIILVFFMVISIPMMRLSSTGAGQIIAGASAIALLITLSVFLHEIAHLVVGRKFGVQATEIALTLLGGHAVFQQPFKRPWHGAVVAVSGPAVNLAIAGVLVAVRPVFGAVGTALQVISVLITMNVALALFNLIPGLPLDGGAVVQDLVWERTGSQSKGTMIAATTGQISAVVIGVLGVLIPMSQRQMPNYSLLMVVGFAVFFLWQGGATAKRRQKSLDWFETLSIYEYLSPAVALPPTATVREVTAAASHYPGATLVVFSSTNVPVGYVVPQALRAVPEAVWDTTDVSSISSRLAPGAVLRADTPMLVVFQLAARLGPSVPFFVVMDGTSLIGTVDAAKTLSQTN